MRYQFIFGPVYLLSKLVITYFGFYLYQRTRLKGSLLFAIGMLILFGSHLLSQYAFKLLQDLFPLGVEVINVFSIVNMVGYILFTVGFIQMTIALTRQTNNPFT